MLAPGTMLGPYKIVAAIGAGGMGEVYRAQDTRLGRDVAVKVLTRNLSNEEESLRRFEQEARAAGMLNHPNILAIYDIGGEGEARYIVSELLEGESLRARIRQGPVPPRKALDYAAQIARGLAAAHERGIIHRDLKPENLFITRDGHVKILDFGLAKLAGRFPSSQPGDENANTLPTTPTEPGRLLGTVGYMSPEQVRGGGGDSRSDIFAFGAILYEMLTGQAAFRAESPIETLNSILKDEPPDFLELNIRIPATLDRVVRHCLEKNPDERFQSARDLAFDLGSLSGLTSQAVSFPMRWHHVRPRQIVRPLMILLAVAAAVALGFLLGERQGTQPSASFKRLTYRSGTIFNARFSPDGQTVFYGARWAGAPVTIFSVRADSPESRDLQFGVADILSVSRQGLLAISLDRHAIGYLRESGTLAQVPIAGGAPRQILDDVEFADWSPDGRLAVVRTVAGRCRLEFPIGKVLYDTVGWISHPRFSPSGDAIAFLDHPFFNDDRGSVFVQSLTSGVRHPLTRESQSVQGLAWTPDGKEIWFAGERGSSGRSLDAVTLGGRERVVTTSAGAFWLHDIAPDGRALVTREIVRAGIVGLVSSDQRPRDLSWLDYSVVRDLSADGKTMVFSESGEAGGAIFGVYVRQTDGSPAIRLGDGTSESLSPDGRWVLSIPRNRNPAQIVMLPTGAGQPRVITHDAITHRNARWFPDGSHILFQGNEPGAPPRIWIQALDGKARPITPENVAGTQVTPDGKDVLGRAADRKFYLYPVGGGKPVPVPALRSGDVPTRFTPDGKSIFVGTFGKVPAVLYKVDLITGARVSWREAMPADPSGLINVGPIFVTPDGATTVYSYTRLLSDLYLVGKSDQ